MEIEAKVEEAVAATTATMMTNGSANSSAVEPQAVEEGVNRSRRHASFLFPNRYLYFCTKNS